MYGTITQQGTFVAPAAPHTLKIRSDVDWIKVYNPTSANAAAAVGFEYYWQRGMAVGTGGILFHGAASTVVNSGFLVAPLGFTLVNSSTFAPSASVAVTGGTNVTRPVYSTGNTLGMAAGAIVRIFGTDHQNINGIDFTVDTVVDNVSFRLANTLQQAPGRIAGAAGSYRLIAYNTDEYNRIYPSQRTIANITQAAAGVVTTLVDHSLTTGQQVRMSIPEVGGLTSMYELNGQLATVTVLTASTFSINIDTTGYTAFQYPPAIAGALVLGAFTGAQVIPLGGFAGAYNQSIDAATTDNDFIGIKLGYDTTGAGMAPAGITGQTMYWLAGKSANV
jgi:hypothetical protein